MSYEIKITPAHWTEIIKLCALTGAVAPPAALVIAIDVVHKSAEGRTIDLTRQGLDVSPWTIDELSTAAKWLLPVMAEHDAIAVRKFCGWILAMIFFELRCRIKESEPAPSPTPKAPKPGSGPLN